MACRTAAWVRPWREGNPPSPELCAVGSAANCRRIPKKAPSFDKDLPSEGGHSAFPGARQHARLIGASAEGRAPPQKDP